MRDATISETIIERLSKFNDLLPNCTLASLNDGETWIPLDETDVINAATNVVQRLILPMDRDYSVLVQRDGKTFRCRVKVECMASIEDTT